MAGDGGEHRDVMTATNGRLEFRSTPGSALVEMRFLQRGMAVDASDAAFLISTFATLARSHPPALGPSRPTLGFLVDCTGLVTTEPGWRATLADYFQHAAPLTPYVAWYGTSVSLQVTVEMFAIATPAIVGKHFDSESEARAWLREQGFE